MRSPIHRIAAVAVALACLPTTASAQVALRNIVLKANRNDYPAGGGWGYSACWGYVHPDGREYAILGTVDGTAIYNVTDPNNVTFVKFIPGLNSSWREMKSYRTWIYVVTENAVAAGGIVPGVQIIRMTDPQNPVLAATYAVNFNRSHTIQVDTTRALLICNGTNFYNSVTGTITRRGMRIMSLQPNPEAPVELASWPAAGLQPDISYYIHDCVGVGNRLYASSIYVGIQRIFDFTTPSNPVEIKNWTYPSAFYSHSSWPDPTQHYLYVCDEQNGQFLRIFDISNETNPVLVGDWTSNPNAIIHNPRVKGNTLWLANYTEGIRALDISDPAHPAEWGYADSYPGPSGGYNGVWECYPYFPSGTIIASDMNTGLYVYQASPYYGVIHVSVTDGVDPVSGATVYVDSPNDSSRTSSDGVVAFAPNPGSYTVTARKFGYQTSSAVVTIGSGSSQNVNLTLVPKALTTFAGTLVNHLTGLPLEGGEVNLRWTPVHEHSEASGAFDLGSVPIDVYRVDVRRPGFIPVSFVRQIGPGPVTQTFRLIPAARYDPLTTDAGWVVGDPGDGAGSGVWTRVEPLGTSTNGPNPVGAQSGNGGASGLGARNPSPLWDRPGAGPLHEGHEGEGANAGQVQPEYDRSPAPDSLCWVTGQGTSPTSIDENDVDSGPTTLTSPAYDATGMADATIGFWMWFYSQFGTPDDWLAISISNNNGASWAPVDTVRGLHNHWEERAIRVADYLTPTAQMRLRFAAADMGVGTVVEAAIDDISVYDAATPMVGLPGGTPPSRLAFRAPAPNPSNADVTIALDLPRAGPVEVEVLDLGGRVVASVFRGPAGAGTLRTSWNGFDSSGRSSPPGLYFARARMDGETTSTKLVRTHHSAGLTSR